MSLANLVSALLTLREVAPDPFLEMCRKHD